MHFPGVLHPAAALRTAASVGMSADESSNLSWFERRCAALVEPQPDSEQPPARAAAGGACRPELERSRDVRRVAAPQVITSELHVEGTTLRLKLTQVVGATAEAGGADSWSTQEDLTGGLLWETCAVAAGRCLAGAAVLTPLDPRLLSWEEADLPEMPTAAEAEVATAAFRVRSRAVVELGAGTGAVGIAAALLGASVVVLTDLPQHCGNIARNCRANDLVVHNTCTHALSASQTGVHPSADDDECQAGSQVFAIASASASASAARCRVGPDSQLAYAPAWVRPHAWGENVGDLSIGRAFDIVILSELLHWPGASLQQLDMSTNGYSTVGPLECYATRRQLECHACVWHSSICLVAYH